MANEKRLIWGDIAENQLMKLADYYKGSFSGDAFERAAQAIAELPWVDAVEVVHGAWMDFADSFEKRRGRMDLRCSVCRNRASKFVYGTEDWWDGCKPSYCPNCGAKMDGDWNG